MTQLVPLAALQQEIEEAEGLLAQFGDVTTDVLGKATVEIHYTVEAPGHDLPKEAELEFVEWYHRTSLGWLRDGYKFEYRPRDSRRAHHMGHRGVSEPHQHCEPPGRRSSAHYADYERLLRPTAEELATLFVGRVAIDCRGLRPVRYRVGA